MKNSSRLLHILSLLITFSHYVHNLNRENAAFAFEKWCVAWISLAFSVETTPSTGLSLSMAKCSNTHGLACEKWCENSNETLELEISPLSPLPPMLVRSRFISLTKLVLVNFLIKIVSI
jgi:hypothetical protein